MDGEEQDTDTSLALLASLLEPATYSIEELIEALTSSNGDIGKAAEVLLLPRVKSAGKRRAGTSLESWLGKKRDKVAADMTEKSRDDNLPVSEASLSKPLADLSKILQQPPKSKPKITPQPAILLASQESINAHHLPVTLQESPLSPAFASALYLAMMKESDGWERNRWYLAGNWVESPHLMTIYARVDGEYGDADFQSRFYYSGTEQNNAPDYPLLLKLAADLIEPVVNASLEKRRRFPLEYAGPWRANVCGANRYDGANSSVGWHADQLTYLGPYATIASLSLGTPRAFRLRETDTVDPIFSTGRSIRTYEVNLGHNSLVLMNAGCQERYKHTIPSLKALDLFRPGWDVEQRPIPLEDQSTFTSRINLTFRFYRQDFHPSPEKGPNGSREGTPICKCGIPTLLRADQKAKARSRLPPSPSKPPKPLKERSELGGKSTNITGGSEVVDDDMAYFWQCQSPGQTGDLKGCGFFRILDMKAEGRGPCMGDL